MRLQGAQAWLAGGCDYCLTSYYVTEVCAEAKEGKKCRATILHIVPAPLPPPPAADPQPSLLP